MDGRKLGESLLLLGSLIYAALHISSYTTPQIPFIVSPHTNPWLAIGTSVMTLLLCNSDLS